MARRTTAQLNIRSETARRLVADLMAETGRSATQIVEEAVRAYRPPPPETRRIPENMIEVGPFLVAKSRGGPITLEETNAAIEADRNRAWLDDED